MYRVLSITIILIFSIPSFAQHLTAPPIYGPPGTSFAQHVAMDALGEKMIVSEPYHKEGIYSVGRNKVFEKINNEWQELGDPFIGNVPDWNGHPVDISGDGLTITMTKFNSNISHKYVSTYRWENEEWILVDNFTPGYISKLNHDGTAMVTSRDDTTRMYQLINDEWQQSGQYLYDDTTADGFDWSVDLSDDGTFLIRSEPIYNGPNGNFSGFAKMYELVNDNWIQKGATINGPSTNARCGWNTTMSSDGLTVAITTLRSNNNAGDATVYEWIGNAWVQKGSTINGNTIDTDLGWGVAMSSDGNHIAVSTIRSDVSYYEAGKILKYSYLGGDWIKAPNDILGDASNRNDGNTLAISDDGNLVLTSASGDLSNRTGQIRQFEYSKIYGNIYADIDQDCTNDFGNESSSMAEVTINPGQIPADLDQYGTWYIDSLPDGDYTLQITDNNSLDLCQDSTNFEVVNGCIAEPLNIGLTPKVPDVIKGQVVLARYFDCIDTLPNPVSAKYLNAIIQPGDIAITTDFYGKWQVTDLLPGQYTVYFIDTNFIYTCADTQAFTVQNIGEEVQLDRHVVQKHNTLFGKVFDDIDEGCYLNNNEPYVPQVLIQINGQEFYAMTDTNGMFLFENLPIAIHNLVISTPDTSSSFCYSISVNMHQNIQNKNLGNLGMIKTDACVYADINVDGNRFRSCFEYQKVNIQVSSPYYSIDSLIDPYILAELDPAIIIDSSEFDIDTIAPNTYHFDMPNIAPNERLNFSFWITVDCDTPQDATLCNTFTLMPVDSCGLTTAMDSDNTASCEAEWDGSDIKLDNQCLGDSISFIIRNDSDHGMSCYVPYEIFEDYDLIIQDSVMLDVQDSLIVIIPATKGTYRMTCAQHPSHPGLDKPVSTIERCGNAAWIPSIINDFYQNDANRHVSVWCPEITGSFDPNDKIGYPKGVGENNYILPNLKIKYKVRFQNTGNDTAFNVVVIDTLDTQTLNIATFTAGGSSHEYNYTISNEGILSYTFANIMLPDSIVDEPGSNGYFVYSITQKPDLPDGTIIDNSASIYFDFNDPIKTETYSHTVHRPIDMAPCSDISTEEETMVWTGAGGNNLWLDPINWSTNLVPTACTDVSIVNSGFIFLDTPAYCNSLHIDTDGYLYITNTGSLIATTLKASPYLILIDGYLYNEGMIQLTSMLPAPLDISGTIINVGNMQLNTSQSPAILLRADGELQSSGSIIIDYE